ncbi:MAG: hypothetical protein ACPL68_03785, partial [Candidatus Hydrothermia bacterium]
IIFSNVLVYDDGSVYWVGTMTVPMWFLALGAVAAGWIGPLYHSFVAPVFSGAHPAHAVEVNATTLIIISVSVAALGILVAGFMYWIPGFRNRILGLITRPIYTILYRKYWVDEIYDWIIVKPLYYISLYPLYKGLDTYTIDRGLVDGTGWLARAGGKLARALQRGNTRTYALLMLAGLVLIFYLILLK